MPHAFRLPTRLARPLAASFLTLALLGLVLLGTGCRAHFPSDQIPKTKWLVLPFDQPPSFSDTPTSIRGWWLAARTIRQNARAGTMMADVIARRLDQLDYISLVSSTDLKYYFADKRQLLKDKFPQLEDKDLDQLITQVPGTEFGRELGVDKVLSGRILRHFMGENRTIHWWWAVLDAEVTVTDVATGKVEWSRTYNLRRQFASMSTLQEDFAERVERDLKHDYFRPLAGR